MNLSRFKIGMRTLKTGIAITASLWLTARLNVSYPIFTTIAVITTMQLTINKSLKEAKNIVLTTIFGAAVGIIFSMYLPHNDIFGGIGAIAVMHMLYVLKLDRMITVSAMVFIGTFLSFGQEVDYALARLFASLLGVAVAVSVNWLIASVDLDEYAKSEMKIIQNHLKDMLKVVLTDRNTIALDCAKEEIFSLRTKLSSINLELLSSPDIGDKRKLTLNKIRIISQAVSHMFWLCELSGHAALSENNILHISKYIPDFSAVKADMSGDDSAVYNYHLKNLLTCLDRLDND